MQTSILTTTAMPNLGSYLTVANCLECFSGKRAQIFFPIFLPPYQVHSYFYPQVSKTFLMNLAVPNKQAFCLRSQQFISIFLVHVLKPLLIVPKAPVIIGITNTFCIVKVSLSLSSIHGIILPFFAFSTSLMCRLDMLHQLSCILPSACQQLRCLVCCAPVCSQSVQRSPTVSSHRHFFTILSGVCVHTTCLHLKLYIFYTLPSEQLHQL